MGRRSRLIDGARIFRSKNAGPFRTTIDIFYADPARYLEVKGSGNVNPGAVAARLRLRPEEVEGIFFDDTTLGIKVTVAKHPRMASGEPGCTDTFGAQQYIPLKDLIIE